jgi:hypothetical protein
MTKICIKINLLRERIWSPLDRTERRTVAVVRVGYFGGIKRPGRQRSYSGFIELS